MPKLFALVVGVDYYDNGGHLYGCVNDAKRLVGYLQTYCQSQGLELKLLELYSEHQATGQYLRPTRSNILLKFQEHFFQATKEDIVLFSFSGHGSQEPANPYFTSSAGTGKLQTLLACDSRTSQNGKDISDILDKEIRYLVHRVWKKTGEGAQIVLLQDSCHSEGASRTTKEVALKEVLARLKSQNPKLDPSLDAQQFELDTEQLKSIQDSKGLLAAARYWPEQLQARKFDPQNIQDTFCIDPEDQARFTQGVQSARSNALMSSSPFEEAFPLAPHLHFSACARDQFAFETFFEDAQTGEKQKSGIFTYTLIQLLQRLGGKVSYLELWQRLCLSIDGIFNQTPTFFAHPDTQEQLLFLQQKTADPNPRFPLVLRQETGQNEWFANVGILHGLPIITKNQQTGKINSIPVRVYANSQAEPLRAAIVYTMPAHCKVVLEKEPESLDRFGIYYLEIDPQHFYPDKAPLFLPEGDMTWLDQQPQLQGFWRAAKDDDADFFEILQDQKESSGETFYQLYQIAQNKEQPLGDRVFAAEPKKGISTCLEYLRRWMRWKNITQLKNPLAAESTLGQELQLKWDCPTLGTGPRTLQAEGNPVLQIKPEVQSLALEFYRPDIVSVQPVYLNFFAAYANGQIDRLQANTGEQIMPTGECKFNFVLPDFQADLALQRFMRGKMNFLLVIATFKPVNLSFNEQEAIIHAQGADNLRTFLRGGSRFLSMGNFASDWLTYRIPFQFI